MSLWIYSRIVRNAVGDPQGSLKDRMSTISNLSSQHLVAVVHGHTNKDLIPKLWTNCGLVPS